MDIFEIMKVFIISVVEGITEWLPVSSTGHMILVDEFVKLDFSEGFKNLFLVVIQLGAILAVVFLYFSKLNPLSPSKTRYQRTKTWSLWVKVLVGCIPAVIAGLLFDDAIEQMLAEPKLMGVVIAVALIFYGIIFILVENRIAKQKIQPKTKTVDEISLVEALKVGGFQVLSLIPGTSRSGSTIIGGLISGLSREAVTEFTFFMGIPIMFGASLLKIVKFKGALSMLEIQYLLLAVVITLFISIFSIKFIIGYIKKNDFRAFGRYRIGLGVLVLLYFLAK